MHLEIGVCCPQCGSERAVGPISEGTGGADEAQMDREEDVVASKGLCRACQRRTGSLQCIICHIPVKGKVTLCFLPSPLRSLTQSFILSLYCSSI